MCWGELGEGRGRALWGLQLPPSRADPARQPRALSCCGKVWLRPFQHTLQAATPKCSPWHSGRCLCSADLRCKRARREKEDCTQMRRAFPVKIKNTNNENIHLFPHIQLLLTSV